MNQYKVELIDTLRILSDIDAQKNFADSLTVGDPVGDLICGWFDTGFFPDSESFKSMFTAKEWQTLCAFNTFFDARVGGLPDDIDELLKSHQWGEIVAEAKIVIDSLTK